MTKKCLGCGVILQTDNETLSGYTPSINNKYCQRCFKINHYNASISVEIPRINEDLVRLVNEQKYSVIFLIDFFNIYKEVINLAEKIKNKKIFVITKSDLIPKNLRKERLVAKIKEVYKIKDEIILVNSVFNDNVNLIRSFIKEEKEVIFLGLTNTGKSSLINALALSNLTVSKYRNTTLDLIKIKIDEGFIYDTPGFNADNYLDGFSPKKRVNPRIYQLKSKYMLEFLNIKLKSNVDNNLVFFLDKEINIEKKNIRGEFKTRIKVPKNSDLIIKGLGFIYIKEECVIDLEIDDNLIEVRNSIVGGSSE